MRRPTVNTVAAALGAVVMVVGAAGYANATEADDERSQLVTAVWQMHGQDHSRYAEWNEPQTYLGATVPACLPEVTHVQVDQYKYGTDDVRAATDAILADGVLTHGEDARVLAGYTFATVPACAPTPAPTPAPVTAQPAAPVAAQPTFAG